MKLPSSASDRRHRALADPVRRRLLDLMRVDAEPRHATGLADAVGLHPNTVRGHLAVLEGAGLVMRTREGRRGPGRPRVLYSATPGAGESDGDGYRLLAGVLATSLEASAPDPAFAAEVAGREWGARLVTPMTHLRPGDSRGVIVELLEKLGFDPEEGDAPDTINLRDCPFRQMTREHADVVCSIHRGLMQGAADALPGAETVERLDPFVEPSRCHLVLRSA